MSDRMPERMSESMPERMSDRMSEYVFNIYFQMVCQKLCQGENHSMTFFLFLSFFPSLSLRYIYILIYLYIYILIYYLFVHMGSIFHIYNCNYIYINTERRYSGDSLKSLLNALDLDIVGVFQGFWTPFGGFCRWMKTLRILWSTPINAPKWAFGVYHFKGAAFKRPRGE